MDKHEPDLIAQALAKLEIPPAASNATYRIMKAAEQTKRRQIHWLNKPRQLRALLYIPSVRYVVMASVVAFFIAVGLSNRIMNPAAQSDTQQVYFDPATIPDEFILHDIELAGDDPLTNFWDG